MATYRTSAAGGASSGTANRTAVITPAVGDLLLVFCNVDTNTSTTPTCSDTNTGGTYTLIRAARRGTNAHVMSCFVRDALMVNTTSTTVTVATGSNTAGSVVIIAISGMERTGATAIRQSAMQENEAASGTPAPALASAALTANLTLTAVGNASNPATMTQPSGWTERQDVGQTSNNEGLSVCTRDSGFTGTTITWGGTSGTAFSSVAIELDNRSTDKTLTFPSGGIASGFASGTATTTADWPVSAVGGIATGFAAGTATVTAAAPEVSTALTGVLEHPSGWRFTPLGQSPGLPGLTRVKRVEPVLWQDFAGTPQTVVVTGIAAPATPQTITEVGSGGQRAEVNASDVPSTTVAFPADVVRGNTLFVVGALWAPSPTSTIAVTDTLGTSYTVSLATYLANFDGSSIGFIAHGTAPASGPCTVTIDPDTSGNHISAGLDEFFGIGPLSGTAQWNFGTGTAISTLGVTAIVANSLLVGVAYTANAGGTLALDAPYTEIYTDSVADAQQSGGAWNPVASAGTGNVITWTASTSQAWRSTAKMYRPFTTAFGTPTVTESDETTILPGGIASGEAVGAPTVTAAHTITLTTGIASAAAFGSATVTAAALILPGGIASAEGFGVPALVTTGTIAPSGIASAEAFGTATVVAAAQVLPSGIASGYASGTATLLLDRLLQPTGIASGTAFGTATVTAGASILPSGIPSGYASGTATLLVARIVQATGIASGVVFGTAVVTAGGLVRPLGILTAEAFGAPTLVVTTAGLIQLAGYGIGSAEAFGTALEVTGGLEEEITETLWILRRRRRWRPR